MKTTGIFVFSILIAAANSLALPKSAAFESVVDVTEDTLGNYKFAFDSSDHSKHEERSEDGFTKGRFTFVDLDGVKHTIEYHGGAEQGFLAKGDDIPVEIADTPENEIARQEHLSIFKAIESDPRFEETPEDDNEDPISPEEYLTAVKEQLHPSVPLGFQEDTPEIALAKAEHAKAHVTAVGQ